MNNNYSYVYILTDDDNDKLYIGVTSNLIKRIYEHKNKQVAGYTKRNNISLFFIKSNSKKNSSEWRRIVDFVILLARS